MTPTEPTTATLIVLDEGSVAAERLWLAPLSDAIGEPLEALGGVYEGFVSSRLHLYPPRRRRGRRWPLCSTLSPDRLGEFPHEGTCRSCLRIASSRVEAKARLTRTGGWHDPVVGALRRFANQRPTLGILSMQTHLLAFDALIGLGENPGATYRAAAYLRREAPSRLHAFREFPDRPPIALCSGTPPSGALCRTPHDGACMNCAARIGPHPQKRPHGNRARELTGLVNCAAAGAFSRGIDAREIANLLGITPDTLQRRIRNG
jgi:hypothetical protein